jgi:hypothetical protein
MNTLVDRLSRQRKVSLELPDECYANPPGEVQIAMEAEENYLVEKMTWFPKDGIKLYIKGAHYPQKGFTDPKTMWSVNIVKKSFIEVSKILGRPVFLPSFALIAFRWRKYLSLFLQTFDRFTWSLMSPFILEDDFQMPVTRELRYIVTSFLLELKADEVIANRIGLVLAHIIEYDNAYRLRIEDVMGEAREDQLQKPKELFRLLKVYSDREINRNIPRKIRAVFFLLRIALFVPAVRKAYVMTMKGVELKNLQLDEIDRYWVLFRTDYNFLGKSHEERKKLLEGFKVPEKI